MYKNFIAVITFVDISKSGKWSKYKLLTKRDANFHNIMIANLFNCMCVNGTLHIVHTVLINEFANNKVGVLWLPIDRRFKSHDNGN